MRSVVIALICLIAAAPAQARHHHVRHHYRGGTGPIACSIVTGGGQFVLPMSCAQRFERLRQMNEQRFREYREHAYGREAIVSHPAGCPHVAFCGCGAALEVFGHQVRALWLARAWLRFPPASPGPGMAAVRTHHVMIIREYLGEDRALVYDANSGHHLTRVHVVSLRGYRIVNPRG